MNRLTMSAEHLQRIFEVTRCAVSKDKAREILQYTKVTVNDNSLIAEALDGYKLIRLTLKTEKQTEEPFEFYIKPFPLPKDLYGVEILLADNKVELKLLCASGEQTHIIPQPKACFPAIAQIIPNTDTNLSVSVNASLLTSILKAFVKTDVYNSVKMSFLQK